MSQQDNHFSDLAEFFLSNPRIASARRFDAISLKIILGLQSELREIECRGFQDISSGLDPSTFIQSSTGSAGQAGDTGGQLATFDDVRKKMETYQDFVLRFIKLYSLKPMDHYDYDALNDHLMDFSKDHPTSKIKYGTWTDNKEELVGLLTTHLPKRDRFTEFLPRVMSWVVRRLLGKLYKSGERNFYANEKKIAKFIVVLNVFIASILNMVALFVLYAIHSTLARIGTICAFSLLFMLSAVLFTAADPITVYNSTAAYSAVLVVFISNVN